MKMAKNLCPRCKKAERYVSTGGKVAGYCKPCARAVSSEKYAKRMAKRGREVVKHPPNDMLRRELIRARHELAQIRQRVQVLMQQIFHFLA